MVFFFLFCFVGVFLLIWDVGMGDVRERVLTSVGSGLGAAMGGDVAKRAGALLRRLRSL